MIAWDVKNLRTLTDKISDFLVNDKLVLRKHLARGNQFLGETPKIKNISGEDQIFWPFYAVEKIGDMRSKFCGRAKMQIGNKNAAKFVALFFGEALFSSRPSP